MKIIQFVNTLAATDGGPARNSFELNLAFNRTPGVTSNLYWVRGPLSETVISADQIAEELLPVPGPRLISGQTKIPRSSTWRRVAQDVSASDVVIIHGYYLYWAPFVALLAKILGTPVFCMPHGSLTLRQQKYGKIKKVLFDTLTSCIFRKNLNSFVVGSPIEKDELAIRFPASQVQIAGVGVEFVEAHKVESRLTQPIELLSISRIAHKKRIDLSISAVFELKNQGVEAHLTIAGTGDNALVEKLQRQSRDLEIFDRVQFIGHVNTATKQELMLNSDFFLLPSEDENFGIGFAEAVMSGLPSIVSQNVASAAGYPSQAGAVLSRVDCSGRGLADAVVALLPADTYLIAVEKSHEFAMDNFSWNSAVSKWLNALRHGHEDSSDSKG